MRHALRLVFWFIAGALLVNALLSLVVPPAAAATIAILAGWKFTWWNEVAKLHPFEDLLLTDQEWSEVRAALQVKHNTTADIRDAVLVQRLLKTDRRPR